MDNAYVDGDVRVLSSFDVEHVAVPWTHQARLAFVFFYVSLMQWPTCVRFVHRCHLVQQGFSEVSDQRVFVCFLGRARL